MVRRVLVGWVRLVDAVIRPDTFPRLNERVLILTTPRDL